VKKLGTIKLAVLYRTDLEGAKDMSISAIGSSLTNPLGNRNYTLDFYQQQLARLTAFPQAASEIAGYNMQSLAAQLNNTINPSSPNYIQNLNNPNNPQSPNNPAYAFTQSALNSLSGQTNQNLFGTPRLQNAALQSTTSSQNTATSTNQNLLATNASQNVFGSTTTNLNTAPSTTITAPANVLETPTTAGNAVSPFTVLAAQFDIQQQIGQQATAV
jgi:hypothetical protein